MWHQAPVLARSSTKSFTLLLVVVIRCVVTISVVNILKKKKKKVLNPKVHDILNRDKRCQRYVHKEIAISGILGYKFLTDVTMRSSSWGNAQQRLRRRLARDDASHFDLHHFQHHFLISASLGHTTSDAPMLRISLDEV